MVLAKTILKLKNFVSKYTYFGRSREYEEKAKKFIRDVVDY
jgi:hypothetical protein